MGPTRRGRPPQVTVDDIVDAALELGIEDLTMRDLADRLGVGLSTLYYHVGSREELVTLSADRLVARLELNFGDPKDWESTMRDAGYRLRRLFETTPGLAMSAVTNPAWGETVASVHEVACGYLVRAGFAPATAWLAVRTMAEFVEDFVVRAEGHQAAGHTALAHAAKQGHPTLQAAYRGLGDEERERRFAYGVDCLIRGIRGLRHG